MIKDKNIKEMDHVTAYLKGGNSKLKYFALDNWSKMVWGRISKVQIDVAGEVANSKPIIGMIQKAVKEHISTDSVSYKKIFECLQYSTEYDESKKVSTTIATYVSLDKPIDARWLVGLQK